MSSTSPPPNSPVVPLPPAASTSPPPPPPPLPSSPPHLSNSPPPDPVTAPPPLPNLPPPQPSSVPPSSTPPPQSPPPTRGTPPPRMASSPPPDTSSPPPQPPLSPPPSDAPPPQPSTPPTTSPPPNPQPTSPPPPPPDAPPTLPPPSTSAPPPADNPPLSPPQPPNDPPPPPSPSPPSPPPPRPPRNSPPPPSANPPESSPPPPSTTPPPSPPLSPSPNSTSPPVPSLSPPPPPNSTPRTSPPPSVVLSPPPPFVVPPSGSPPPPFLPPSGSPPPPFLPPSGNNNTNGSGGIVPYSPQSPSGSGGIGTGGTVAIVMVATLLLFAIFGTVACCVWKRKKKVSGQNGGHIMPTSAVSGESDSSLLKMQVSALNNGSGSRNGIAYSSREGGMSNSRSWFTYDELLEATGGFTAQNLLGEGGFGSVYKGNLTDGRVVAVKQLKIGGGQGEREFSSEVEIISRIHHRHLVSLVGYCISEDKRLLVYEYVANDTLYFHLHGEGRPVMDWTTRVRIATGAARGIAYLHEDCHPRIIHRDIKSSNILLDTNFEARVADFGLAKLAMDANTHITTRVMGTFGYMAPEYASSGKLTEKSDVYSFGVVLLELVTGRKPVDSSQPLGEESLVEWARPLLSHALETEEFERLVDPRLEGEYVDVEMFRMIQAAAACVRHSSSKRPKMGQVVRAFDSIVQADLTNGMRVGESEIFNSAQQSAEIRLFRRMAFGYQDYSTDFFNRSSSSEGPRVNSQRN